MQCIKLFSFFVLLDIIVELLMSYQMLFEANIWWLWRLYISRKMLVFQSLCVFIQRDGSA